MLDPETFLVEVYVLADEFAAARPPAAPHPGPAPALSLAEVLTLAAASQWARYPSERAFYRYADAALRPLFPRLPSRPQLNRAFRRQGDAVAAFALWLAERLGARAAPYEALDCTAAPTRNAKRRGRGWLVGLADVGRSGRLGWYHGLKLLVAADPAGVVTGWGVGPASANDRALAEALFALRAAPDPRLPSAGRAASGVYAADTGFAGRECEARWVAEYGAQVVAPPQPDAARAWPRPWRRWLAGVRQVVETVVDRLLFAFRLERERPHALDGLRARLAAKAALHNAVVWLNRKHGRPDLAIAEVLAW